MTAIRTRWEIATATHIGGRAEQQDRVSVLASATGGAQLVVVADGMGGMHDGAAAAQRVVDTAARVFRGTTGREPKQLLEAVCFGAHEGILAAARRHQSASGSTCALLYLSGTEAYWMHVGDSRLYHFAGNEVCSRTEDHSVAALVARSQGTSRVLESGGAAGGHQLYMCLGGSNGLAPEFGASAIAGDDWFLLCTDGFWNSVTAAEVARFLRRPSSLNEAATQLVDLARGRAGHGGDNVTVALVRPEPRRTSWLKLVRKRRR